MRSANWQERHLAAVAQPTTAERPVVLLMEATVLLCDEYDGQDVVLREAVVPVLMALRVLSNRLPARLDGRTVTHFIQHYMTLCNDEEEGAITDG